MFRGEVLEDEPYTAWAFDVRGSYQGRVLGARLDAADAALAQLDFAAALAHAEAAAALDRFSERAYRTGMLALYALDRSHEALGRYREFRRRLDEELGLAYSVYTFQSFHADVGMHGVYVGTGPETARDALEAIHLELADVANHGLPESELAMGKSQLKGQITLSLESVTARMYRCAAVELYGEPYRSLDEMLALVDSVTSEQVAEVAREFFAPERQTVVSLGPGEHF